MTAVIEKLRETKGPATLWLEGVADEVLGASASPSGSRPSDGAQEVSTLAGVDPSRCDWCVGFIRRDCEMFKRCVKQATGRGFS